MLGHCQDANKRPDPGLSWILSAGYDHISLRLASLLLSSSSSVLLGLHLSISLHELESAKLRFCISAPRTALKPRGRTNHGRTPLSQGQFSQRPSQPYPSFRTQDSCTLVEARPGRGFCFTSAMLGRGAGSRMAWDRK